MYSFQGLEHGHLGEGIVPLLTLSKVILNLGD